MRVKHVPEPPEWHAYQHADADVGVDANAELHSDPHAESDPDAASDPGAELDSEAESGVEAAVARIRDAQSAVPLVPGTEDDCCARLQRRVGFPSRDVSRTWLTFLRGLGFAEETDRGFRRTRTEPTPESVRRGLLTGIVGAREVADALCSDDSAGSRDSSLVDGSEIDRERAFDAVRESIPRWERTRTDDWETVWRERTDRLLGWFLALGLAERAEGTRAADGRGEGRYRPTATLGEVTQ